METRLANQLRTDAEIFAKSLVQESTEVWQRTLAAARLSAYLPDPDRQEVDCPYCWIVHGEKMALQPADGHTIRCYSCANEYKF
jgi:hypothetical protein